MARISIYDVKAWVESTKLDPQALDLDHLSQIEEEILARLGTVYDTSTWVDKTTTPKLVQVIIAKTYTGWLYDKYYSENQNVPSEYAQLVKQNAETLIQGLVEQTITIPNTPTDSDHGAVFYPNDYSSSISPDTGFTDPSIAPAIIPGDTSTGPAKFSMGRVF